MEISDPNLYQGSSDGQAGNGDSSLSTNAAVSGILRQVESAVDDALTENALTREQMFRRYLGGDRSTIDEDSGYLATEEVEITRLYELWQRDPIARRIINIWPEESWRKFPELCDVSEEEESEFEAAFEKLCRGMNERSWADKKTATCQFWSVLRDADKLSGIGNYGCIVLGFNKGKLHEPLPGFEDDTADVIGPGQFVTNAEGEESELRLLYMQAYSQYHCEVTQWETGTESRRYGLPKMYSIRSDRRDSTAEITQPQHSRDVHWSRVVHICPDGDESRVTQDPRLLVCLNRLWDLKKEYAGAGEGFWQGALPGISLEPASTGENAPRVGTAELAQIKPQIESFLSRMKRSIVSDSLRTKMIAPNVVSPKDHTEVAIEAICIVLGIPVRIFKGSERGELASSQDESAHDGRCEARRESKITPHVIAPVIDRFIAAGVLPEPSEGGWEALWPSLREKTDKEKAELAKTLIEVIAAYIKSGAAEMISPLDFLTKILDFDHEEAEAMLEAAAELLAEAESELPEVTPDDEAEADTDTPEETPPGGASEEAGDGGEATANERQLTLELDAAFADEDGPSWEGWSVAG